MEYNQKSDILVQFNIAATVQFNEPIRFKFPNRMHIKNCFLLEA